MIRSLLFGLALGTPAAAQSPIFGVDVRQDNFFSSDTGAFVANYVATTSGTVTEATRALDFNATATTLYGVDHNTKQIYTFDLATGALTPTVVATGLPGATGLTADPNGVDWWASYYDASAGESLLYKGDINTGVFALVGRISAGIIIELSMNLQGEIYAMNISNDSLYTVDTTTGLGTLIGTTGINANFANGMDFDWSTGILYATINQGNGVGQFSTYDLATGVATPLDDLLPLDGALIMAVQQPASAGDIGTEYCLAAPNSTGAMGTMSASGSTQASVNDLTIRASNLPRNQFGIFLTSSTQAFVPGANGTSNGNLCLGGMIGRYTTAAQILSTGPTGEFSLAINLMAVPQGNGTVAVMAGETRNFQAWTRDGVGLGSNFSDGLQIDFN